MTPFTTIEFECPECGGNNFSTDCSNPLQENWIGLCSGQGAYDYCPFNWKRSEDWRYFVRVTTEHYDSQEEYQKDRE